MGQSLSALIAATLQNLSASRRCHSLTEAVYLALLSFFGLISSFHNTSPAFCFLFFVFWIAIAFSPTITFPIIYQRYDFRQAISIAFLFFIQKERRILRIARSNGQYEVLKTLVLYILHRERRYIRIERQNDFFFRQHL